MSDTPTKKRITTPSIDSLELGLESTDAIAVDTPPSDTKKAVWVVTRRYAQTVIIVGVFSSEDTLFNHYPFLEADGASYRDCDPSGNGLTATKVTIDLV